jgi:hypothetical protein
MKAYQPDSKIDYISFEGYIVGKLFCEVIKSVKGEITHESFLAAMHATQTYNLNGLKMVFSETDHQGIEEVYLTEIFRGEIQPLE